MKKSEMKKLAFIGLSTGLLVSTQSQATVAEKEKTEKTAIEDANYGNEGYHLMTDDEILLELNSEGAATYKALDAKGKEMARFVASQRCNGTNMCAGLNACQTDKNKCMGMGACKGQGKCAISDKNMAVKLVSEKLMKEKRKAL